MGCGSPVATARVTGPDMNHNGIPDCLERPGCGVSIVNPGCGSLRRVSREELISRGILLEKCSSGQMIPACSPGCRVPIVNPGSAVIHPGCGVPMAAVRVTGPDMNLNGIPDALELPAYPGCGVPMSAARVTGPDMNLNGIPDALERSVYPGCTVPVVA